MGDLTKDKFTDPNAKRYFTKQLLNDITSLEKMLNSDYFETGITRIGAEQELCLIDENYRPTLKAVEILEAINDPHFVNEIALYNLEINLDPYEFKGDVFSVVENQLKTLLIKGKDAAAKHNARVLLTGILPTLRKKHLEFDCMTPNPRYEALNDTIKELRGANFELSISGIDELIAQHENILFEACNTSFQVHLQVDPDDFVKKYNWAQAISGPVLAATANSPLLMGKRLWSETRIALFQQSIDVRNTSKIKRDKEPRVSFGKQWLKGSVVNAFKDNISRYPLLFASEVNQNSLEVLKEGKVPSLDALRLHNGTVYKWNRACYGLSGNNKAHLRIENRYIPSGPTVLDEIANTAFWLGLMVNQPKEYDNIHEKFSFEDARYNFYNASRTCIDTSFKWVNGGRYNAKDLILNEFIPLARAGLKMRNIDKADIDRLMDVIEERVSSSKTGSKWITRNFTELLNDLTTPAEASVSITRALYKNSLNGNPVHKWENIDSSIEKSEKEFNLVNQVMSADWPVVFEDDLVDLVVNLMDWNSTRYIPVENENNELTGLITSSKLIQYFKSHGEDVSVKDVMIKNPVTIGPEESTKDAITLMVDKKVGCLPVMSSDNRLLGMLTERDVVLVAKMAYLTKFV